VLPQLAAVASECAEYAISRLYEMTWPPGTVVTYTSALIELCGTEAECERAMTKVMAYLCGFSRRRPGAASAAVEAEELPSLVHHLAALCRKVSGKSSVVPSLVNVLATVLDDLTASLLGMADNGLRTRREKIPPAGRPDSEEGEQEEEGEDEETMQPDEEAELAAPADRSLRARQMKQMQPVVATIVHHISVMVSRNQVPTLLTAFLYIVFMVCLFPRPSLTSCSISSNPAS
jgi:hypothetical protein